MGRTGIVVLIALTVAATTATAQSQTHCYVLGNTINCNTSAGIVQIPGWGESVSQLGTAIGRLLQARRQAQLRQAQMQAAEAVRAQQEAWAQAAAAAAEAQRAEVIRTAADRESARQRLFAQKAMSVIVETTNQLGLYGAVGNGFARLAAQSITDLYKVNPDANRLQIFEVVEPHVTTVYQARLQFFTKYVTTPAVRPLYDSIMAVANADTTKRDEIMRAVLSTTDPLFMEKPSNAEVSEYVAALQSVLDEYVRREAKRERRQPNQQMQQPAARGAAAADL